MSGQSTHPFTCNTCQVAFKSSELQRTHMQTDWHRYNLKRRVASLPPLSSEIFAEKVLASRASAAATAARASFEKVCEPCGKTYFSENAFTNHLSSQKHRSNAARAAKLGQGSNGDEVRSVMSSTFSLGEPAEKLPAQNGYDGESEDEFQDVIEGVKDSSLEDKSKPASRRPTRFQQSNGDDDRPEHPLSRRTSLSTASGRLTQRDPLKECLFCSHMFDSLPDSVEHMVKTHGLFIPEPNYVSDFEGLIKYLNQKINEEHQCLYCGRLKWSEDGIKTHMRDMSHCKIAYETEEDQLEIGQFYDFRSTYSDDDWDSDEDEEMQDGGAAPGGGVKLGAKRTAKVSHENGDSTEDDEGDAGWETDSTVSSCPTEELGRVYVDDQRDEVKQRLRQNIHHNHTVSRPHRSTDGYHSHAHSTPHAVYHDEVEMHLPSGRTAGHRSQNKYWRQNLRTYPTAEERIQRLLTGGSSEDERELRGSHAAKDRERGRGREVAVRSEAKGIVGVDDLTKRALRVTEKKEQKRAEREQRKFQARVNEKGNNQKHFRDPLLQ